LALPKRHAVLNNFFAFSMLLLSSWASAGICDRSVTHLLETPLLFRTSFGGFENDIAKKLELSKSDRINIACQIKEAILSRYSLIDLKKERLNLDSDDLLELCVQREVRSDSNNRPAFADRMKACLAFFQDSHLQARLVSGMPLVYNGVVLSLVRGKVVVTGLHSKLISFVEKQDQVELSKKIQIGAEVVSVDDVPALDAAKKLATYISSSSRLAALREGVDALFSRDFHYPLKSTSRVIVKNLDGKKETLDLRWFGVYSDTVSLDAALLLSRRGIQDSDSVTWNFNSEKNTWSLSGTAGFVGYDEAEFGTAPATFYSSGGQPVLHFSQAAQAPNQTYCLLQIRSFNERRVFDSNNKEFEFLAPISYFLEYCEGQKLPVVLDLRNNGGGLPRFASSLLSLFSKTQEKLILDVTSLRMSDSNFRAFAIRLPAPASAAPYDLFQQKFDMLVAASKTGAKFTQLFTIDGLKLPSLKNGFNQKIAVLISPSCVSACEMTAALLKANRRGILIGSQTNGTGAGFSMPLDVGAEFADSFGIFKFKIPNHLFGIAEKPDFESIDYAKGKHLLSENRPTTADVFYETHMNDVLNQNAGWKAKISEVLFESVR